MPLHILDPALVLITVSSAISDESIYFGLFNYSVCSLDFPFIIQLYSNQSLDFFFLFIVTLFYYLVRVSTKGDGKAVPQPSGGCALQPAMTSHGAHQGQHSYMIISRNLFIKQVTFISYYSVLNS